MSEYILYTDGGCHGNPGPGGWAFLLEYNGKRIERNGGEAQTTNNRMELSAVIYGLQCVAENMDDKSADCTVRVYTDSQYVRNGITNWIHTWLKNGWKTSSKKPVKNRDLWMQLHELSTSHTIEWEWLKGHAGHAGNERCDALVQAAIAEL